MADPFRRLLRKHASSTMAVNASRTWLAVPISERTGWAEGGPLWMLEHGVGGPEAERLEFRGRVMFPERLHVVATVIDITTSLLSTVDEFASQMANEVSEWATTADAANSESTQRRLEAIRDRHR